MVGKWWTGVALLPPGLARFLEETLKYYRFQKYFYDYFWTLNKNILKMYVIWYYTDKN